jgi:cation:H+ antiporter
VEHVALFVLGLALLAVGAPMMVFGSARLDRRIGRDPFAVGAVAVAFGPCVAGLTLDLAIVLRPAPQLDPRYALAGVVGHIAGSAVAGIGLVLGAAALVRPVAASARLFYTAIPLVLVAALLFWFLTVNKVVSRAAAGALLGASGVALVVLGRIAKGEGEAVKTELAGWVPEHLAVWRAVLLAVVGLAALLGGAVLASGRLLQAGSVLRTSTPVLGATVASFGTALPALGAAVVASYRRRSNLALGIAVGFVLFDLLLVVGAVALVQPLPLTQHAIAEEIPAVALFAALLVPVFLSGLKVPRWAGALLLAGYAAFVVWQVMRVR